MVYFVVALVLSNNIMLDLVSFCVVTKVLSFGSRRGKTCLFLVSNKARLKSVSSATPFHLIIRSENRITRGLNSLCKYILNMMLDSVYIPV